MGLLFRPRRPLLRLATGATTAAMAYNAGRRREEQDAYNEEAAEAFRASQPAAPAAPTGADPTAELQRLAQLHESGALDDREFAAAKAKLLGL